MLKSAEGPFCKGFKSTGGVFGKLPSLSPQHSRHGASAVVPPCRPPARRPLAPPSPCFGKWRPPDAVLLSSSHFPPVFPRQTLTLNLPDAAVRHRRTAPSSPAAPRPAASPRAPPRPRLPPRARNWAGVLAIVAAVRILSASGRRRRPPSRRRPASPCRAIVAITSRVSRRASLSFFPSPSRSLAVLAPSTVTGRRRSSLPATLR